MISRFLRRPPGWLLAGAALLCAAAFCWANSSLGTAFGTALLAFGATSVVVACWLFRTVASAITARRFFARTLVVPLIFGATAVLIGVDAPARLRFAQARPGFEHAVTSIEGGADPARFAGRIGTYRVSQISTYGRDVYFTIPGGFLGTNGLAYLPDGPSESEHQGELNSIETPFTGPWYKFSRAWD
ncbi:hypothetical protein [Mycolicibacterium arseniciresistens]|uniref:DUF1109 domain-containing protein n=1 Tax=Mycolicibacterium arseniciresistens TaxID=3062257 RepID=A0ABT8UB80_9MYCO|nr:hypothetical protein [Mycolicibacterium arseniciresistens]MDO3635027.1 hypothetical protein [Mycolicibacterium arseniciresistens]